VMVDDECDPELRDAVKALLDRCDHDGRKVAAIHLEQAWLVLGGRDDPAWLVAQVAALRDAH
jgi:anti-sigma factor RsiW